MIKIFQGTNPSTLEKQANDFMQEIGRDCPVREEVLDGTFILVVFYNGVKTETNVPATTPINIESIPDKPKSNKVGALWQKGDEFTGTIENKKVKITKETWDNLPTQTTKKGDTMKILNLQSGDARILKNQFKNTPKHPDYVVLQ